MVEAPSALRNSVRLPMKVSATSVVVTVVPTFAPRIMGMAPRMGNAPDPTAVTAIAVVVVDDWIKTVPSTPTDSPTQGFAAKALCAASLPSPAKPRLIMLTAQISRYISPATPHQPRALVQMGSWIPPASNASAGTQPRPPSRWQPGIAPRRHLSRSCCPPPYWLRLPPRNQRYGGSPEGAEVLLGRILLSQSSP